MVKKGGKPFDEARFARDALRADLCAIAQRYTFFHGTRLVDEILDRFEVQRRPLKERARDHPQ